MEFQISRYRKGPTFTFSLPRHPSLSKSLMPVKSERWGVINPLGPRVVKLVLLFQTSPAGGRLGHHIAASLSLLASSTPKGDSHSPLCHPSLGWKGSLSNSHIPDSESKGTHLR